MTLAEKVVVVGQGYVGLPLAIRAVDAGYDVVGFDLNESLVRDLAQGRSHIRDVDSGVVRRALATGAFRPSSHESDIAGFDIAVITVPTPLRDGAPDVSHIRSAADSLARFLRPGACVVLESTTYPGTTEDFVAPILERGSGLSAGVDFHLGFSPERIDPGNRTWDLQRTPKIVSGVDQTSLKRVQTFYDDLVDETVPTVGTREAEMAKLLENTFRHVNIALVNELAVHARALGVDFWDVIAAARTKPFGFMPFYPGPGVGGHCLPIDPSYLSWQFEQELGTVSKFIKVANDVNNAMPAEVARRVQLMLNDAQRSVKGSRILVLGAAYKKNSTDARETPATPVIRQFLALGAEVRLHDDWLGHYELDGEIERVELSADELSAADVVVVLTDHDTVDYQLVAGHATSIFDARHVVVGDNVEYL